jgi:predicted transposase YbfD/YdcC
MTSSLITALTVTTPGTGSSLAPVTDGEQHGLLDALSKVPDPRDPRGIRYPLSGLLTVAVCAVLAGASSFAAITDWLHDLDDHARDRLGFDRTPAGTTVWRLLTRLDADLLATVLAGWLTARTRPPAPLRARRYRPVIAVDGKTLRGAHRDGRQVHLLSALDTSTGIVLAQVTVDAKSNEIPAFTPLLDAVQTVLGSLTGILFVADALHTQAGHARQVAERGAHLMTAVKGNQPKLFAQLKTLPWPQIPAGARTRNTGHGRRETRTVKAVTLHTPGGIGFPHAQQAIRITRTRTTATTGKTSRETVYLTVSLPASDAPPTDLQDWIRREWLIENQIHHVRDVTFREDLHQARTGTGPAVIATLRNTAIGWHRTNGDTNIARALRRSNRRPHDLITAVTSSYATTQ